MSERARKSPPRLPLKVKFMLATHTFGSDAARRSDLTVNRSLLSVFDPKVPASAKPIDGVTSFDTSIDHHDGNLWFRLYNPTTAPTGGSRMPLIVYFHGGGFFSMGADTKRFDQLCRRFTREVPAVVISVNYRLAPEYQYPLQYQDGFDALKFIDGMNFENFSANVDLGQCFMAGDGAGGNLAHYVTLRASEYDFSNLKIIGLIALQPFFGGKERTESEINLDGVAPVLSVERTDWAWKAFMPQGSDRNHHTINVFGPNGEDISGKKFPPTLVFAGGFDILQDWQRKYCEGLKKCGKEVRLVEYPDAIHGFYTVPELPETSLMMGEVRAFVQNRLRSLINE
ncbi:hypothetical protein K2173_009048 [Erythroxylum novogranatense]|uniref:Alpha/beta hydrolase fold-3 domain-containing protein n=1 Tax=Erythroxylum novogranatense TaxID=1862640 RepID=A0AAV8TTZ8_9ROSI|nr:hypothetical protein K2173_009048 [Erythroxylum novogranatense]